MTGMSLDFHSLSAKLTAIGGRAEIDAEFAKKFGK